MSKCPDDRAPETTWESAPAWLVELERTWMDEALDALLLDPAEPPAPRSEEP